MKINSVNCNHSKKHQSFGGLRIDPKCFKNSQKMKRMWHTIEKDPVINSAKSQGRLIISSSPKLDTIFMGIKDGIVSPKKDNAETILKALLSRMKIKYETIPDRRIFPTINITG